MRELTPTEIANVSGGNLFDGGGDDELTLPTVVVPGEHIYSDPWTISIDMDTIRASGLSVGEYIFGSDYDQLIGEASDNAWDALAEGTGLTGEVLEQILTSAEEHANQAEQDQDWEQYQEDMHAWLDQQADLQAACEAAHIGIHMSINGLPSVFWSTLFSASSDAIHEAASCDGQ